MINNKIKFGINNTKIEISLAQGIQPLAKFLREQRHLTGVKIVCAEGDCGACAVLVDRDGSGQYHVLNSCILPLMTVEGSHIITIEGLAEKFPDHPIKSALMESLGSQCGFCTPGFMVTLTHLYEQSQQKQRSISEEEVKIGCSGHLCRCTGYQDILGGVMKALEAQSPQQKISEVYAAIRAEIFAEEDLPHYYYVSEELVLAIPRSLKQACFWKAKMPTLKIVAGATDLGVELNKKEEFARSWMSLKNVKTLNRVVKKADGRISIGANVSLSKIQKALKSSHPEFSKFLKIFASPNIRNCGTLIGNIVNASPIGDTIPYLAAIGATVKIASLRGFRDLPLDEFIVGYRRTALMDDEIVVSIILNPVPSGAMVRIVKVSKREHMDISTLSMVAIGRVENGILVDLSCVFGGLSDRVQRITSLEKQWLGQTMEKLKTEIVDLSSYFNPLSDHRGSQRYRRVVAERLLGEFLAEIEAAQ